MYSFIYYEYFSQKIHVSRILRDPLSVERFTIVQPETSIFQIFPEINKNFKLLCIIISEFICFRNIYKKKDLFINQVTKILTWSFIQK